MSVVTRLCFGSVEQNMLPVACELLDLTDIKGTYCYCSRESLAKIKQKLKNRKSRGITLIGNGSYHYVTYLLISELNRPFTLVLFDHHTDLTPTSWPEVISCGSWVFASLQNLPQLKKVVLIGVNDELVPLIPEAVRRQVSVFPCKQKSWRNKSALLAAIPTDSVYLSIDKDVLAESDAVTDWEQGTMKLEELLDLLHCIASRKRICGMDICGEYPLSLAYKKRTALKINARANSEIIRTVLRATTAAKAG